MCVTALSSVLWGACTFDPARNVQEAIRILTPDVASVQPTVVVDCFFGFLGHVQVSHEHLTTSHTDLTHSTLTHVIIYGSEMSTRFFFKFFCPSGKLTRQAICLTNIF